VRGARARQAARGGGRAHHRDDMSGRSLSI
jgi:hypothetical protein